MKTAKQHNSQLIGESEFTPNVEFPRRQRIIFHSSDEKFLTASAVSDPGCSDRCMKWLCRVIGHKPNGTITGFRQMDAAAITRCARCDMPIVATQWRATRHIMDDLYKLK